MKKARNFLIGLAACLLCGCPYSSKVPSEPAAEAAAGPGLTGTWVSCSDRKPADCMHLSVYRFGGTDLYAETSEPSYSEDGRTLSVRTGRYRAFPLGRAPGGLLDLQELELSAEGQPDNIFVRAVPDGADGLKIYYVSDNYVKKRFSSPEELSAYLRANLDKPGFFEYLGEFKRTQKRAAPPEGRAASGREPPGKS